MRHNEMFENMRVVATQSRSGVQLLGDPDYSRRTIEVGMRGYVTRVNTHRSMVRWDDFDRTTWFDNYALALPEDAPPPPRKLGVKPEGDEYIGIDDPRIQWIWEDLGKYADGQGWCPQYEDLAAKVGIPGRPREWNIRRHVIVGEVAVDIRQTITATSEANAERVMDEWMAEHMPGVSAS